MSNDVIEPAYTFDDLLLVPASSSVIPAEVDISTLLTSKIKLNIPLVSAAMDTVTEYRTAIIMAREGGLGIIHKNMSINEQARQVEKVKKSESGMIIDPVTVTEDQQIADVQAMMANYKISGVPVLRGKKLAGIVTNRDLRFVTDPTLKVKDVMTSKNLVTAEVGITLEKSKALLHEHRIEKLLVVDSAGNLKGLITIKDIEKIRKYPNSAKDDKGRLLAGAALGVGTDYISHADKLIKNGVDVVVLDSAHGHSENIVKAVENLTKTYPGLEVIAGNVATAEGTEALIKAGASAVKIGVGPGSICTTRIVAGVGVPQLTAIKNCARIAKKYNIPLIGSLFAGAAETPGETFLYQGRAYKGYRGMGSLGAMRQGSSDRYFQEDIESPSKMVPEGIEGKVPFRGPLSDMIYQLVGGLRSGMGYVGASNIEELRKKAKFVRITAAGLKESHVHDVIITKEAPNYRLEG